MKPTQAIWISAISAILVWGCGRSQAGAPAPSASSSIVPDDPVGKLVPCPIGVEGAQIDVADAVDGADLTITSDPNHVDELRRRARDAASLYGIGSHKGLGHRGAHLGAQRHGLRLTELPPLAAEVEDIDGGARMHVRAKIASQADELRSQLRERVDQVRTGPCD